MIDACEQYPVVRSFIFYIIIAMPSDIIISVFESIVSFTAHLNKYGACGLFSETVFNEKPTGYCKFVQKLLYYGCMSITKVAISSPIIRLYTKMA